MKAIKKKIKQVIPNRFFRIFRFILHPIYCISILMQPLKYERSVKRLHHKKNIKVAFFATFSTTFKYSYLYELMQDNPLFNPIIVICPIVNYDRNTMLLEMEKSYRNFSNKGYKVICAYNKESDSYVDVKKELNPDIIFYTTPYEKQIDERYFVDKFLDRLTCYVSYNFGNSSMYSTFHDLYIHNIVWKLFAESDEHKKYSIKHAFNRGRNVVVTGYPGVDYLLNKEYGHQDMWKIKDRDVKRIIWAPHHSLEGMAFLDYSCFLKYSDFMFEMAEKYKDKIQITFKPHPLLKANLYKVWGGDKTNKYYAKWDELENGQLVDEGEYHDLFLSSDAMIHDCGSFINEYMYTLNPVMRTDTTKTSLSEFNGFTQECLQCYYHAKEKGDIERFIVDVVINGNDYMKEKRMHFYQTKMQPPHGKIPSKNILDYLINQIS